MGTVGTRTYLDVSVPTDTNQGSEAPGGCLKVCDCGQIMSEVWYKSINGRDYCSEACFIKRTGRF